MEEKSKLEELTRMLGLRVRDTKYDEGTSGTVIGVYLHHESCKNDLKIVLDKELRTTNGHQKLVYRKLSEVKEIATVTAFAFISKEGTYTWSQKATPPNSGWVREPNMDMSKEVSDAR